MLHEIHTSSQRMRVDFFVADLVVSWIYDLCVYAQYSFRLLKRCCKRQHKAEIINLILDSPISSKCSHTPIPPP